MFDSLIESDFPTRRRRTGGYLLGASVMYFAVLVTSATMAIMWFNPGLAEALEMNAKLTVPIPLTQTSTPRINSGVPRASVAPAFVAPERPPDLNAARHANLPQFDNERTGPVGPVTTSGSTGIPGTDGPPGVPGAERAVAPPPPAPTPSPVVATPVEARPVSEGVLRGRAIATHTPLYPEMARRIRLSGQVQIQVLISEDGRVIEATILNGHPLLRGAAAESARRWIFTPTKLSGVPVKVQGILTFNFTMN